MVFATALASSAYTAARLLVIIFLALTLVLGGLLRDRDGAVQLRLIPVYARLSYSPGFWAFTFSYAIVATDALLWLKPTRPPGATACAIVVVTLITLLIVAIAVRTVVALGRGQFFPARQPAQPFQAAGAAGQGARIGPRHHRDSNVRSAV